MLQGASKISFVSMFSCPESKLDSNEGPEEEPALGLPTRLALTAPEGGGTGGLGEKKVSRFPPILRHAPGNLLGDSQGLAAEMFISSGIRVLLRKCHFS